MGLGMARGGAGGRGPRPVTSVIVTEEIRQESSLAETPAAGAAAMFEPSSWDARYRVAATAHGPEGAYRRTRTGRHMRSIKSRRGRLDGDGRHSKAKSNHGRSTATKRVNPPPSESQPPTSRTTQTRNAANH